MINISVIIPVYNVEPFVKRCLESVVEQDQADAHMECIVVDDRGQDRSMEIVHETIDAYHGPISFEIIVHERNLGLSMARNSGLARAKGDYVLFIDSDDHLMPGAIQYFLDQLKLHPDVDMIMGNGRNGRNGELLILNIEEPWLITDRNVFFQRMLHHQIYLYAWNKLIRRSVLVDHHVQFEEGIYYEDQLWSYQLFSNLTSVLLLPWVTYFYEYNENSIVNTTFTEEKADKSLWSYTVSCNKMLDNPPDASKYSHNMTVDYLLFMTNFLMNGVDVLSRCPVSEANAKSFYAVRKRLLLRSVRCGRVLLSFFFLLLFPPLSYLQKIRTFRHHYYDIESVVNHVGHLTDFLHRR